jgi:hypothetical protein
VKTIRSDNRTKYKNRVMDAFCDNKGIARQYNAIGTLQQNGVADIRNRTLIEAARTMLTDSKLSIFFWAEAINTTCYVQNRILLNKRQMKTPYEIFYKHKPNIGYFKAFGCRCTLLHNVSGAKFEVKSDECYFV